MPTLTVTMLLCVTSASGTDTAVNQALAALPEKVLPDQFEGVSLLAAIQELPAVIAAIDAARSDPDNLFVTTDTSGDADTAIWPGPGEQVDMQANQTVAPKFSVDFEGSQNLSLWDYDAVSDNDLLGSITGFANEAGQGEIAKLASSTVEGSSYYVFYTVD